MLCLSDSIRHPDPSVQPLLSAVEDARSLTALILAAWQVARVLAVQLVEAVLAERAGRATSWPPCPVCGTPLHSKGLVKRQVTSLLGPLQWRRRVGRCPRAVPSRRWRLWMRNWGCRRISERAGSCGRWAVPWRLRAVCDRSAVAELVQRWLVSPGRCGGVQAAGARPWKPSRQTWTP